MTNDLTDILAEFAARIEQRIVQRITGSSTTPAPMRNGKAPKARKHVYPHCYYPGCKNKAAPSYAMFCAALHKDLPKKEKEKYTKQHYAATGKKKRAR